MAFRGCARRIQDRLHWLSSEKLDESDDDDDAKDVDDVTIILDDNEEDIRRCWRKVDAEDNDEVFVVKGRWERNATPPPPLPAMKAKPRMYWRSIIW